MAELKPTLGAAGVTRPILVFHGGNAVAELKLVPISGPYLATWVFHGGNAVAELKRQVQDRLLGLLGSSTAATPWPN